MRPHVKQRGAAVIVALMIVALAAAAAAAMVHRQHLLARQMLAARDYEQALWVLRGAVQWARAILAQDARDSRLDHPGELWAAGLPPTRIEQATLAGEIAEAQGRFNLNNLVRDGKASERDREIFERLLRALGLGPELAQPITDWVDADGEPSGRAGAEDAQYLRAAEPYRAANRPMSDVAELQRVRGCDAAVLARLLPFVVALPRRTAVNVNFAPPQVLMAVVPGLTLAEALELVRERAVRPFRDRDDFRARLPRRQLAASDEDVTVQSDFFLVRGHAELGRAAVRVEALIERSAGAPPAVIWQRAS
jgi:general secretion pathway protein K